MYREGWLSAKPSARYRIVYSLAGKRFFQMQEMATIIYFLYVHYMSSGDLVGFRLNIKIRHQVEKNRKMI